MMRELLFEILRRTIRSILGLCPPTVAREIFRQIQGTCYRLGAPRRKPIVTTRYGSLMELDLRDRTQRMIYYHSYEFEIERALSSYLKPGGIFVDIGANVGYYTLWAARRAGDTGQVLGFEPVPRTFTVLEENVRRNNLQNVRLFPVALGAGEGAARMAVESGDAGLSYLATAAVAGWEMIEVPIRRLDHCLQEAGITRVDVMKIDAEGAETGILKGAGTLIEGEQAPVMVLEVDDRMLQRQGSSEGELLSLLEARGYRAFEITGRGGIRPCRGEISGRSNLLFLPPAQQPAA